MFQAEVVTNETLLRHGKGFVPLHVTMSHRVTENPASSRTEMAVLYPGLLSGGSVPANLEAAVDVQGARLFWCYMKRKTTSSRSEVILYRAPLNTL